jgi:small subunit ribosomal protein S5
MPQDTQKKFFEKEQSEFADKVVQIKRVSKKTKGGNQIHFTALVVSGDKKSRVGVGLGKAKSVADAIKKGIKKAQNSMIEVPLVDGTIPSEIKLKFKSAVVLLKPGKKGSGLIAGGPVRAVVELSGIKDVVSKIIGSKTKSLNVWTAFKALTILSQRK